MKTCDVIWPGTSFLFVISCNGSTLIFYPVVCGCVPGQLQKSLYGLERLEYQCPVLH